MTNLSPAAQAVVDAFSKSDPRIDWRGTKDSPFLTVQKTFIYGLASALRASLDHSLTAQQILDIANELDSYYDI
jgi:hypothetical protein